MTSWIITARKTSPVTEITVEAETRELAIVQAVEQAAEGEQIEVLQCIDASTVGDAPAGGATGATGTARMAGATGAASGTRTTRAQLNEMSKDELLAVADREDVEVSPHWSKADIVDTIVKHKG